MRLHEAGSGLAATVAISLGGLAAGGRPDLAIGSSWPKLRLVSTAYEPNKPAEAKAGRGGRSPGQAGGFYVIGTVSDDNAIANVQTADGKSHRFLVDSGSDVSLVDPALAKRYGVSAKQKLELTVDVGGNAKFRFAASPYRGLGYSNEQSLGSGVEGVLGSDALAALQVELDSEHGKLLARFSQEPLSLANGSSQLLLPGLTGAVENLPMVSTDDGDFAVETKVGGQSFQLELDTGSGILALPAASIKKLGLSRMAVSKAALATGDKRVQLYLARDVSLGDIKLLWPVFLDSGEEYGVIGTFALPCKNLIIDFPGKRLLLLKPSPTDELNQATSAFLGYQAAVENGDIVVFGGPADATAKAVANEVAGRPARELLQDMVAWQNGDTSSWKKLRSLSDAFAKDPEIRARDGAGNDIVIGGAPGPGDSRDAENLLSAMRQAYSQVRTASFVVHTDLWGGDSGSARFRSGLLKDCLISPPSEETATLVSYVKFEAPLKFDIWGSLGSDYWGSRVSDGATLVNISEKGTYTKGKATADSIQDCLPYHVATMAFLDWKRLLTASKMGFGPKKDEVRVLHDQMWNGKSWTVLQCTGFRGVTCSYYVDNATSLICRETQTLNASRHSVVDTVISDLKTNEPLPPDAFQLPKPPGSGGGK